MRCVYGLCTNDSRYKHLDRMKDIRFYLFPRADKNVEKCKLWVERCGRSDLTLNKINRNKYVCSKHFVGENGPTDQHPDPIPFKINDLKPTKLHHTVKRQLNESSLSGLIFLKKYYVTEKDSPHIKAVYVETNVIKEATLAASVETNVIRHIRIDENCTNTKTNFNISNTYTKTENISKQISTDSEEALVDSNQHSDTDSADMTDDETTTTNYQKFEEIFIKGEPSKNCELYENVIQSIKEEDCITDDDEQIDKKLLINNDILETENINSNFIKEELLDSTSQDCELYKRVLQSVKKEECTADNQIDKACANSITINNENRKTENTNAKSF